MKTQNDTLREEFQVVLNRKEFQEEIEIKKLDPKLVNKFFEILLENNNGTDDSAIIDSGRARFETYIINTLKEKNQ